MSKRNRSSEDRGWNTNSGVKHGVVKQARGQLDAWKVSHPGKSKIAIVDANAGDGTGIPNSALPQLDLFEAPVSIPTAELCFNLGLQYDADVFLCEKDYEKRQKLHERFNGASILSDHAHVAERLVGYDYAIVISDPCGPRDHGIEHLQKIAKLIPHADFIIVVNIQSLNRLKGVAPLDADNDTDARRSWHVSKERYLWMEYPLQWLAKLGRRHVAQSEEFKLSANFAIRVFVVSNYLSHAVRRRPFQVVA